MSAYNLILAFFVIAGVLFMVLDHRRGWLTQTLVDSLRLFDSPRLDASRRPKRRLGDDSLDN